LENEQRGNVKPHSDQRDIPERVGTRGIANVNWEHRKQQEANELAGIAAKAIRTIAFNTRRSSSNCHCKPRKIGKRKNGGKNYGGKNGKKRDPEKGDRADWPLFAIEKKGMFRLTRFWVFAALFIGVLERGDRRPGIKDVPEHLPACPTGFGSSPASGSPGDVFSPRSPVSTN